ncbi:MAG: pitrilysin family protein [Planctomycetota bacterium]
MQKVFDKSLNERYFFTFLKCGLPVFVIPKKGINEKVVLIAVNYGSIDNSWRPAGKNELITMPEGIAHFLEHQQFKKESGDISMEFARYGSSYNAGTGYQTTTYYFSGTDYFTENLDLLLRLLFTSYFHKDSVEREKSIIEQELRMYADMANVRVYENLIRNLYHNHPVRISIGGTVESVRDITREMLYECYKTFYRPSNMVAVVCGDVQPHQIIQQLEQAMDKFYTVKNIAHSTPNLQEKRFRSRGYVRGEIIRNIPDEPNDIRNRSTIEKMPLSISNLLMGYKETKTGFEGMPLLKQSIITDILLELIFSKSSKLFSKLYGEKLIDDRFGCSYSAQKTFGFTIISADTEQPEILYQRIIDELKKISQKKLFNKRALEQQKRKLAGKFVWVFNSPMAIASLFAGYYFNKIITVSDCRQVFNTPKVVSKIIMKDIQEQFEEHFNDKYHAFSIIKPL